MADPPRRPRLTNPPAASQTPSPGSPFAAPTLNTGRAAGIERGSIVSVDARRHAYRVALASGSTVTALRILPSPGDASLLDLHETVAVTFELGTPYILGVLPSSGLVADGGDTLTGQAGHGGDDPVFDGHLPTSGRGPDTPRDLLPGDQVKVAPGGAAVGALRGGVATLRGGAFARVDAFGGEDLVRVLAGELRVDTWMGYQEVVNAGGRTSYRWRGGVDQVTQSGAGEGRYTLHLDLGHEAGVAKFRVTNREQQDLFRVHVGADGRAELYAAGGVELHAGDRDGAAHERTHHGSRVDVTTRDLAREVGGNRTTSVAGSDTLNAASFELVSRGTANLVATDRMTLQTAQSLTLVAAGAGRVASDGLTIVPGLTRPVVVDATGADRVVLGRGASSHAVKYEELARLLAPVVQRLNDLSLAFATHGHSMAAPPIPTNAPYAVRVPFDLTPARSLVVKLL